MKITSSQTFKFTHDGKESYELGNAPVEISSVAYDHLISVFGPEMFTIVDESLPKGSSEGSSEIKKPGRPKKQTE